MTQVVTFVDTSVMCNLLPVYGLDEDREEVVKEYKEKTARREVLILPVTAVIETSNHIHHIPSGHHKRECAKKFSSMLDMVVQNKAPWRLHEFVWGTGMLASLVAGDSTGMDFVEHAVSGVGGGDLCILCERDLYSARTKIANVGIWTKDRVLASYC